VVEFVCFLGVYSLVGTENKAKDNVVSKDSVFVQIGKGILFFVCFLGYLNLNVSFFYLSFCLVLFLILVLI
jgi:hypothetical protein